MGISQSFSKDNTLLIKVPIFCLGKFVKCDLMLFNNKYVLHEAWESDQTTVSRGVNQS